LGNPGDASQVFKRQQSFLRTAEAGFLCINESCGHRNKMAHSN